MSNILDHEVRRVAIIYKRSAWGANDEAPPRIAPKSEVSALTKFTLCEVGPPRDKPDGLMVTCVYEPPTVGHDNEFFQAIEFIKNALEKPVLFAEDFTETTTVLL